MGLFDLLFGWLKPKPNVWDEHFGRATPSDAPDKPVDSGGQALPGFLLDRLATLRDRGPLNSLKYLLGLNRSRLAYYAFHAQVRYLSLEVPKKDGSARQLHAPVPPLKFIQRRILTRLLNHVPLGDCVKGFRRRRSIFGNARVHVGQPMVLNVDLRDFFPTITSARVFGLFKSLGLTPGQAAILARLTTHEGHLPQGAPTSPAISNAICRRLDRRLCGLAAKVGAKYSRYADDLTFSGAIDLRRILPLVRKIVVEEGFTVASKKVRITRRGRRQMVTGLTVNDRVSVPRTFRRRLRAIVHNCATHGIASQNRTGRRDFLPHLLGQIAFLGMVHRDEADALREKLRQAK